MIFYCRHSAFHTHKTPKLVNIKEPIPLKLWVEVMPIISGYKPNEFIKKISGNTRKWFFIDRREINDLMYTKVEHKGVRLKVAEIGNAVGNMPEAKCCWIKHNNNFRLAEIEKIQAFAKQLNPLDYPRIEDIFDIQQILTNWSSGKFCL